jgi:SAM-dependent methyltransferase
MNDLKFTIITPTHKYTPYLLELYQSIREQTYKRWDWVLFLNGDMTEDQVPQAIREDRRVRIASDYTLGPSIGAIKKAAFSLGTGDVLVEVDHDDLITENCLLELNGAFQDKEVGFAYSDSATLHMTDTFVPFNSVFGWKHREFEWRGQTLTAMRSFEPTSHSLAFIWYAPDHVRAWRREVYHQIGGHNPEWYVCDDHDLLIRTYLHTKMHHVDEVLYLYRITGDNTWLERNPIIQEFTVKLCHQYAVQLAEKDADHRGLMKIDLGGGINPKPGYLVIDKVNAHYIHDLNEGIPLPDGSVGVINASHVIEHLRDPIKTMREIHRVLAHGGWAFIEVPSTDGRGAFQDPTHVSYWNENSFWYYSREEQAKYIQNKDIRFQSFRLDTVMYEHQIAVTTAWMVANKEGGPRLPHLLEI